MVLIVFIKGEAQPPEELSSYLCKRNQTPLPPPGFVRAEAQLEDQVGTAGLEYPLGLSQNLFSSRLCLRVIFPPLATCFRKSHVLK